MESWISSQLGTLLGVPSSEFSEMAAGLLVLPVEDAAASLRALVGESSQATAFVDEFVRRRAAASAASSTVWNAPSSAPGTASRASPGGVPSNAPRNKAPPSNAPGTAPSGNAVSNNTASSANASSFKDAQRVYKKKDTGDSYLVSSKLNKNKPLAPQPTPPTTTQPTPQPAPKKEKKKKTYVVTTVASLDANDRVGFLTGLNNRLLCECLAAKHGLLTNCLTCGKIICNLEGPGPCPSCGELVESAIQQVAMVQLKQIHYPAEFVPSPSQSQPQRQKQSSSSKKSIAPGQHPENRYGQKAGASVVHASHSVASAVSNPGGVRHDEALFPTLASEKDLLALAKAEEQRERLLDYQRNSTARTRVFDTASDFDFQSDAQNKWLTAEERATALLNLKEQERLEQERKKSRVISIDLQNRRVVQESSYFANSGNDNRQQTYEEAKKAHNSQVRAQVEQRDAIDFAAQATQSSTSTTTPGSTGLFQNPTLRILPTFIPTPKQLPTPPKSGKHAKPAASQQLLQPWEKAAADVPPKPLLMKTLRETLSASITSSAQDESQPGYQFTAAMQAKKVKAKREAEARKYLHVERRRVQDTYDFEESLWSISAEEVAGSAGGEEPGRN
ncbi:hypothetical protein HDU98_003673 [Podochytrium sp. JEL0797]|nr:hypothetical protein HDU98_003673 [Podochytrium sp. JEL0797]